MAEEGQTQAEGPCLADRLPGIVIPGTAPPPARPVIEAFVWGGEVRADPILPFGRWKTMAAG